MVSMLETTPATTKPIPTAEDAEIARHALERARLEAALALEMLRDRITRRVLDDATPLKAQIEAYNINKELVLSAQKNQEQSKGTGFKIIFELGDAAAPQNVRSITIEQESDPLDAPPSYVKVLPRTNSDLGYVEE